ncbi:MAG TPA: hypothetical protein VFF78_03665, partial [Anaerolineaceae bacterium]|nr:hypothetical protein [Anaerolineaceae bacterium]
SYNCCFGFIFVLGLWLFIAGPVVLPVRGFSEVRRAPMYLFLHIMGWHGPQLYVENGRILSNQEGMSPKWPGVIVLDSNSAIALEAGVRMPDLGSPMRMLVPSVLRLFGLTDRRENVRVRGSGVVFTWPEEEIHAVMDLRRQFRITIGNVGYTSDGLRVHCPVWIIFTIGQNPEILDVTYNGDMVADSLRMLTLEQLPNGRIQVKAIADELELDAPDRLEFHEFARRPTTQRGMLPYTPRPETTLNCPPTFDVDRVFKASFGQALFQGEMLPWHDLPNRVAVDIFREELSRMNYMDMFNPDPSIAPYSDLKRRVRLSSRNSGILACRLVRHRDGRPLQTNVDYAPEEILVSAPLSLTNSKVLRDRGIKVIAAGFPELKLPEVMYVKRLGFWKSRIDSEALVVESEAEYKALREKNRARADAQRDMIRGLSEILNRGGVSKEALAWRVLQALEQAAVDPQTRQLLPEHTLNTLRMLRDWMLPDDTIPPPVIR